MADDKNSREAQARATDRRQRERDIAMDLARGDEPEPPVKSEELNDIESELESLEFPMTGTEVVKAAGDREVDSGARSYALRELVPETATEIFDSPAAVRVQIQRPTVAAAMKRVVEASETLPDPEFPWSQRKAYEKTFKELTRLDGDDDDVGVQAIADWIIERIQDTGKLPGSRATRRRAAKFCRENGYQIRKDEWLGI